MAKPFGKGKQPANWLRLDETKEYLEVAKRLIMCRSSDMRNGVTKSSLHDKVELPKTKVRGVPTTA